MLRIKKLLISFFILLAIFPALVFAQAQAGFSLVPVQSRGIYKVVGTGALEGTEIEVDPEKIDVTDHAAIKQLLAQRQDEKNREDARHIGAVAFKQALGYFLNSIAYETATWLASGGEGQDAQFQQLGWGEYSRRLIDNSAGHFIEGVSREWSGFKVGEEGRFHLRSICEPNFNVKLGLILGLRQTTRPRPPRCTWSQMQNNWKDFIEDPNFLNRFAVSFDPDQNELGAAFSAYSNFFQFTIAQPSIEAKNREEGGGLKPVQNFIDKKIITPVKGVEGQLQEALGLQTTKEAEYTGFPVADAVGTFVNTLASKLLDNVVKKGLALLSGAKETPTKFDWTRLEGLVSEDASPLKGGEREARQQFRNLLQGSFTVGDPSVHQIDVSDHLFRRDLIDIGMKTAIDNELTITEAIKQGLIPADGAGAIFAFSGADLQPDVHEGYSRDSMIVMRSYGVLPVGWEIAANYIQENFQEQFFSLGDMIRAYDDASSPFYRLVNAAWVLKAPQTFCRLQGPTEIFSSFSAPHIQTFADDTSLDPETGQPDTYNLEVRDVDRATTCVDRKSCIFEDQKNDICNLYGYCTKSKPDWNFNAQSCPAFFNTCELYTNSQNDEFAFLANTLNTKGCSTDTIGCQWYCTDYNILSNQWTCLAQEERTLTRCQDPAGCKAVDPNTGFSCAIPFGGVDCFIPSCPLAANVLPNASFEQASSDIELTRLAEGWSSPDVVPDEVGRVSGTGQRVLGGSQSLRIFSNGGANDTLEAVSSEFGVASADLDTGDVAYILSGNIYNNLIYGQPFLELEIIDNNGNAGAQFACKTSAEMAKGTWVTVSCEFVIPQAAQAGKPSKYSVRAAVEYVDQDENGSQDAGEQSPVGTVWFDNLNLQPVCPLESLRLTLEGSSNLLGSKIFFDRDVKECGAEAAGCTELVRIREDAGSNLLDNGSFERWSVPDNQVPEGWRLYRHGNASVNRVSDSVVLGESYMRLQNKSKEDYDLLSGPILGAQLGKFYILSFYAKSDQVNAQWEIRLVNQTASVVDAQSQFIYFDSLKKDQHFELTTDWQRFIFDPIQITIPGESYQLAIGNLASDGELHIDGVQFEPVSRGNAESAAYSEYGSQNSTYLTTPPYWLECSGDRENDHTECNRYAALCDVNEVGCTQFNPTNGDPPVSGVVTPFDRCGAECVGYDSFSKTQTNFEDGEFPVYFIAQTARQCSAEGAGCDTFTNLDELSRGGEGREFYTYLRQCIKPDSRSCQTFYSWKGDEETGFQLVAHSLKDSNGDKEPDQLPGTLLRDDLGPCVTPLDAENNPNCAEYISSLDPSIRSRRHFQNTITCAEDCHPLRLLNSDKQQCEGHGGFWGTCQNAAGNALGPGQCPGALIGNTCYALKTECAAAGFSFTDFNTPTEQCVYLGVPEQSAQCGAVDSGCREYKGNASGNVRVVFQDDLEIDGGSTAQWRAGTISNESLTLGGHSLETGLITGPNSYYAAQTNFIDALNDTNPDGAALPGKCDSINYPACNPTTGTTINCFDAVSKSCPLQNQSGFSCNAQKDSSRCGILDSLIIPQKAYMVSFWARSGGTTQLKNAGVHFSDGTEYIIQPDLDSSIVVTKDWRQYKVGPFIFQESDVSQGMYLEFAGEINKLEPIFYDFITLKQVQEFSYLIKDSWTTPISCDTNPYLDFEDFPPPNSPQFMLSCQEYITHEGVGVNLKSFDTLCRDTSVGCEAFIDTKNSSSPYQEVYNAGAGASEVTIAQDEVAYYVFDADKTCTQAQKGCARLGQPIIDSNTDQVRNYGTRYLISDPDTYASALCSQEAIGCQEFVSGSEGLVYFKNFPERACEYRQIGGSDEYAWFKIGTNSSIPDCPTIRHELGNIGPGRSCVGGSVPGAPCSSDDNCNPGTTSGGKCLWWTGICPSSAATCTAYVDPISEIDATILSNSNFEGYNKVCTDGVSICQDTGDCNPRDACERTKPNVWVFSSTDRADINHAVGEGFNKSSALVIGDAGATVIQTRGVQAGTLYTLSARCKRCNTAQVEVATNYPGGTQRAIFENFDNSVTLVDDGVGAIMSLVNTTDTYKLFTGRVMALDSDSRVQVKITGTGTFDDVELKKAGVYYQLESEVDKQSCNGVVDPAQGCILFNDTSSPLLQFNALETKPSSPPTVCGESGCDSNIVLKVKPDRVCGEWLDCVTSRQQLDPLSGVTLNFCQELATCDSMNPISGKCNNFPQVPLDELEFDRSSIEQLSNYTEFSKAGYQWPDGTVVQGYYPYGAMRQRKVCVNSGAPVSVGQCLEDVDCDSKLGAEDGDCQPVLDIREDSTLYESCRIYPETTSPRWGGRGPADTGHLPAKFTDPLIDVNNPLGGFETRGQNQLETASECAYRKGDTFFQGLYGFCVEKDPIGQYQCLNWLPVDELTGGWIGLTGWVDQQNLRPEMYYCSQGAVLETRIPRTEDKCYRSGIGESIGIALLTVIIPPALPAYYGLMDSDGCGPIACPLGYLARTSSSGCGDWPQYGTKCAWSCIPDPIDFKFTDDKGVSWYDYKDRKDINNNYTKKHLMYCPDCDNTNGTLIFDPEEGRKIGQVFYPNYWTRVCDEAVKVTDENRSNMAWKRRVEARTAFQDSGYIVPEFGYVVDTANRPFGSINSKFTKNPETWEYLTDKVYARDYKRPTFGDFQDRSNIGQIYHDVYADLPVDDNFPHDTTHEGGIERIKRLFAKSFGFWLRRGGQEGSYQKVETTDFRCAGGSNNGADCKLDPTVCNDTNSLCQTNPGFCTYFSVPDPVSGGQTVVEARDITCADDPDAPSQTCASSVFCANGFCVGANSSSLKLCRLGGSDCPGGEACQGLPAPSDWGECSGLPTKRSCTRSSDCKSGETCVHQASINGRCSTGVEAGLACGADADCPKTGAKCTGACSVGSARVGQECNSDASCRVDGECAAFGYWAPPEFQCKDNTRPSEFVLEPAEDNTGDWCGVAPVVPQESMIIENASGPIFRIEKGSGNATFRFNVVVDDNQLPLRTIEIDWGDNTRTRHSPKLGLEDKRDIADPFVFTHQYKYLPDLPTCKDDTGEVGSTYCTYEIHVRVRDNWGWWTSREGPYTYNGFFAGESGLDTGNDRNVTHPTWIQAQSRVQVCENNCP